MNGHPFTDVAPDDADHLLFMIREAHKPFSARPIHIGDIANEWEKRRKGAHPKSPPPVGQLLKPNIVGLKEAYGPPERTSEAQDRAFDFELACAVLGARWPGIVMGVPERTWEQQPVILELNRLRSEVQGQDQSKYSGPGREMTQ